MDEQDKKLFARIEEHLGTLAKHATGRRSNSSARTSTFYSA